ncbi:MAG TPA: FAD-dependent oxidoreductase [Pyrinomonadaceae bacterium]|nr:FAD-dependent oxidoreductase [Pyrinomonadaceae bacterium]
MHDVVIIGAGPAGLAAALWCDELGLDSLVLEQHDEIGGQLLSVYNPVENYPGVSAQDGRDLLARWKEKLEAADFDLWTNVAIQSVDLKAKKIALETGEQVQSISIILATGVRRRQLGIPGEAKFAGHGVLQSASSDREQLRGKDVCIVGGGDAAAENALMLADICPTVTVVHRGRSMKARREFREQLIGHHSITVFPESVVTSILGDEHVDAVEILRKDALKPFQMAVQAVLIRIGVEPNTDLVRDQIDLDKTGYVLTDAQHETKLTNVFAIGDVSNPVAPTISGAAGAGATAAKVIASRLNKGK